MLYLVTGVPGASKTAFTVTALDKIERQNKINLTKNRDIYDKNSALVDRFADDFSYIEVETGSAHELKRTLQVLPADYFSIFGQEFDDLRPDDYYKRATQYNEIIERITERDGNPGFSELLPVRAIYSNIKALKIDYARANIYDWREAPDGAVFAIDEVQLVEPYSNLKDKQNDIVQELTIHRHRGFDFYFITQAPSLLHPTIKELIGVHYHITRPYGRTPKVYQFGSCRQYPNTLVNKMNCEAKFTFKPADRIFKLYKSTTINTHKPRYPKGILFFVLFALFGVGLFIYGLKGFGNVKKTIETPLTAKQSAPASAPASTTPASASAPVSAAVAPASAPAVAVDPELIRVAAVFEFGTKCHAYNGRGDLLPLSVNECLAYSRNPASIKRADPAVVDRYLQAANYRGSGASTVTSPAPVAAPVAL